MALKTFLRLIETHIQIILHFFFKEMCCAMKVNVILMNEYNNAWGGLGIHKGKSKIHRELNLNPYCKAFLLRDRKL